jgi:small-conductance mechanosensitive channel
MTIVSLLVAVAIALSSLATFAQTAQVPQAAPTAPAGQSEPQQRGVTVVVPSADAVTLVYMNRTITRLRARVLSNMPADRARAATETLDKIVDDGAVEPVATSEVAGAFMLRVGSRHVLTLVPDDVDELTGETLQQRAAAAAAALNVALAEAVELRTPHRLLRASAAVLTALVMFVAAMYFLRLVYRRLHRRVVGATALTLARMLPRETAREPALLLSRFVGVVVTLVTFGVGAGLTYWWLTFSLRRIPYTRPLGESLRARLLDVAGHIGSAVVAALPGLLIVLVIVAITRLLVRVSDGFFKSVERGRVDVGWAHPDTAGATRHLVAIALWLFALIVSYPYLPGSESDAFKGVSVFVGLIISLGSSGIVNQMMSGLTLIYSRALGPGDVVRIDDNEGSVVAMSLLSVKLRNALGEEITVPNTVVVGTSTTNYSRSAPHGGAWLRTSVTIGYATPWRQVRALLMLAAERTSNVRADPKPAVVQAALEDFYIRYHLLVCLEHSLDWVGTRDRLHASILDAFNEHGVQIMSPGYEGDPEAPKIVPRDRWFEKPASEVPNAPSSRG